MKTNTKYSAIALLALGSIFTSCEKSDLAPAVPTVQNADSNEGTYKAFVEESKVVGAWKMTKFLANGSDEMDHFAGCIFYFREGGKLVVVRGDEIKADGRWSLEQRRRDDPNKMLYIEVGRTVPYADLTNRWYVAMLDESQMELKMPYASSANYLSFAR